MKGNAVVNSCEQVHCKGGGGGFVFIEMPEKVNEKVRKRLRQCVLN